MHATGTCDELSARNEIKCRFPLYRIVVFSGLLLQLALHQARVIGLYLRQLREQQGHDSWESTVSALYAQYASKQESLTQAIAFARLGQALEDLLQPPELVGRSIDDVLADIQ